LQQRCPSLADDIGELLTPFALPLLLSVLLGAITASMPPFLSVFGAAFFLGKLTRLCSLPE